jgi:hypothetical protein
MNYKYVILFFPFFLLGCVFVELNKKGEKIEFPDSPVVDQSFVTGQPCKAPCWYDLEIGKSSNENIRQVLSSLSFIYQPSISEHIVNNSATPEQIRINFTCVYDIDNWCGSVETSADGKLHEVYLAVNYPGNFYQPSISEHIVNNSATPEQIRINFTCVYDIDNWCGSVETSADGKLHEVYLAVNYPLNIATAIDHLGPPDYYTFAGPIPQLGGCSIVLIWVENNVKGMIEETPGKKICDEYNVGNLKTNLQIDYLIYAKIDPEKIRLIGIPWPEDIR